MKFKNERDKELFYLLHPALIMIYTDLNWYAKSNYNIDLTITQTVTTKELDRKYNRVSDSHRTARAIDIRTKNIDLIILQDLIYYINNKWGYKKFHYMAKSGAKRLAYYHEGTAEHIHLAIHKKYQTKFKYPVE